MKEGSVKGKRKLLIAVDTFHPKRDGVVVFLEKVIPSLAKDFDITILAPKFHKDIKKINHAEVVLLDVSGFGVADYRSMRFSLKNIKKVSVQINVSTQGTRKMDRH